MALDETPNGTGPMKEKEQQQQQQQPITVVTTADTHHAAKNGSAADGANATANTTITTTAVIMNGSNVADKPANNAEKTTKFAKQTDANTAFLRSARAGDREKLIEFLETGDVGDINASNANGLNALHLAAKDGHVDIVVELLRRGAGVDNSTKKGNSALHIASLAGQREVIKILVMHGADVNLQSQNGFTPLYMASQENHDTCVKYLLAKGANQTLATEDGFTPLAVAMQQGHDRVVTVLLESDTRGKVRLPALHIAAKKDDVKAAALLLENEHNPDVASKSGFTPLHIAAHYGNMAIANLLIDKGANVNFAAKHNITPLHVACKWGKQLMVDLLTQKGAKIDSCTRDGLTPLHCAARSGHELVIDQLADSGANILAKTKNGLAPLHMAAQGEHVDAARILLFHKAPVDEVTVDYLTALHVAAHCGHVKVAKMLLDRRADPNARALNGFTPLHIACKKNRIKVVELLLKHGASKSATTESGLTPLHVASFMGCMNIAIYLLQHDASPDVPTVRGETPLHLAARANQTDIIRILLRNGAQVDAKAREEQTPLHVASRLGNVDIVMLLLQHGANIDSVTKDLYTPLHIAAKEGQDEVVGILIENGARLDAATKKGFTPLHLAGKYGNLKVAELLLAKGAPIDAQGKNGVTPLHVASHYDHQRVALLLLERGASPHASASNGHTPLHIAAKKNQMDIASTLLEYGALADAESKSGFTPIHLAAQEGHTDMSALLLEHRANPDRAAKNGLTPLHLCAQEDKVDVAKILVGRGAAHIDATTRAGFTPLHVAAHFGQINMVRYLLENDAAIEMSTDIGYTPLHQAAQQGHRLIINLLLKHKANPNAVTNNGQTALGIANKLGYITVVETLKIVTETNITSTAPAASVATDSHSGAETTKYKVVAPETMHETFYSDSEDEGGGNDDGGGSQRMVHTMNVYGNTKPVYMSYYHNKTLCEDPIMSDQQQYKYMTVDDIKGLDDGYKLDTTIGTTGGEEKAEKAAVNEYITSLQQQQTITMTDSSMPLANNNSNNNNNNNNNNNSCSLFIPQILDNVDIVRQPIHVGAHDDDMLLLHTFEPHLQSFGGRRKVPAMCRERFLVSFLVDARGGAMRGCRHSGVRVIVPPRSAAQPTRITCRYVKPQRIPNPPPLMEGEALVSRILELAPVAAKFLGPVILEVPHFASLRDKEREIIILRSDNGETWREHTLYDSDEAIQDVLNDSFEAGELMQLEDLHTNRIIRIVSHDFPHFFAVVSRIRQEVHAIGPDGGTVSSAAVLQVQAVFPANALTKKIRVGLQAQPIDSSMTASLLGRGVAVSPVVTVEPRRRKFHKAITLSMPAPRAHTQGMINQYSGNAPTLRLLCSITGGQNRAVWEDVTGSTPLTFVKDCVSFTTTVSARFWLMDCRNITEACRMATELYTHMAFVPFMVKFVVFAKRTDAHEALLSVFCMTDDKEDKTLEQQEHFTEVAKSRDVEILEGRPVYLEFGGNLVPIMKSGEQLHLAFGAFRENRLAFRVRVKDADADNAGRCSFMNEPKVAKGDAALVPLCTLNIALPELVVIDDDQSSEYEMFRMSGGSVSANTTPVNYSSQLVLNGAPAATAATAVIGPSGAAEGVGDKDTLAGIDEIHKADIRLSDICNLLGPDWSNLAIELDVIGPDVALIRHEYPHNASHQAMVMLRLWLRQSGGQATGNNLEQALHRIGRSDIVDRCIFNLELVTDDMERAMAKLQLDQLGFENFKDELSGGGGGGDALDASMISKPNKEIVGDGNGEQKNQAKSTVMFELNDEQMKQDDAALQRVRAESIHMGISANASVPGDNDTPPPSPADFGGNEPTSMRVNPMDLVALNASYVTAAAPTAMAERNDLTQQELEQQHGTDDGAERSASDTEQRLLQIGGQENLQQIQNDIADIVAQAGHQAVTQIATAAVDDVIEAAAAVAAATTTTTTTTTPTTTDSQLTQQQIHSKQIEDAALAFPPRSAAPHADAQHQFIMAERQSTTVPDKIESRIPVASANTSTPIKVKTIKKHSRVPREFVSKQQPQATQRPAVGDIEWGIPDDSVTEISTLQLEDVSSPNEHPSYEPVVIISPSDDYSGEIDEVILVQTPGDDGDVDEDDNDADDDDVADEFSPRRMVVLRTKTATMVSGGGGGGGGAPITVTTEEHYANGKIVVQSGPPQAAPRSMQQSPAIVPQLTISTDDDDAHTQSLSINSDDSSQSDGSIDGHRHRRPVPAHHRTTITTVESVPTTETAPLPLAMATTNVTTTTSITTTTTNSSADTATGLDSSGQRLVEMAFGSSSGSDVALHEPGVELSEDDNDAESDFCQSNELPPSLPITYDEELVQRPIADRKTTTTTTTATTMNDAAGTSDDENGVIRTTTVRTTTTTMTTAPAVPSKPETEDAAYDRQYVGIAAPLQPAPPSTRNTTTLITTHNVTAPDMDLSDSMQHIVDQFMQDERRNQ